MTFRTKEESPQLVGTHCFPSSHGSPPPIVLSPSQLLRGSSKTGAGRGLRARAWDASAVCWWLLL